MEWVEAAVEDDLEEHMDAQDTLDVVEVELEAE